MDKEQARRILALIPAGPGYDDRVLLAVKQAIIQKIVEMSLSVDDDPAIPAGDTQWRKGYKQACSDIIATLSHS